MSASPSSNGDDGDDTHNVKMGASAAERNAPHIAGKRETEGTAQEGVEEEGEEREREKSTTRSR